MEQTEKPSIIWVLIPLVIGAFIAAFVGTFEILYMIRYRVNTDTNDTMALGIIFCWPIIIGLGAVFGLAGAELARNNFQQSELLIGAAIGGLFPCLILAVLLFVGVEAACIASVLAILIFLVIVIRRRSIN